MQFMPQHESAIFINYRQDDTEIFADKLKDLFNSYLPPRSWFLDTESIDYGEGIPEAVLRHLEKSKVLLVLIGPQWVNATDTDGDRRLLQPYDWVRREIEIAKEQEKRIIPIVYGRADFKNKAAHWLKKKVPSLDFLENCKFFTVSRENIDEKCQELLAFIASEAGLPYQPPQPSALKPAASTTPEILDRHFPIHEDFQKPDQTKPPFKGLEHFEESEASIFFGRSAEILKLCRAVTTYPLVLLYGQSGAGKSSLLYAGVLPRMKKHYHGVYLRRKRSPGFPRQIDDKLSELAVGERPTLWILDQVEEIFTDPGPDKVGELNGMLERLNRMEADRPSDVVVLGFRSEFFSNIEATLIDSKGTMLTQDQKVFLQPLRAAGLREAILGIAHHAELSERFKLRVEEKLAEAMSRDLLAPQTESAHVGPLLQYQLRKMWDLAEQKRSADHEYIHFNEADYQNIKKDSLDALFDDQLDELRADWAKAVDSGLVLDVLYGYTTPSQTAAFQKDEAVKGRYRHIDGFPKLFLRLKHHTKLLIPGGTSKSPGARLAHDALAKVVHLRHLNSDAPGQRAQRLVNTKRRELKLHRSATGQLFSENEIITILAGRNAMEAVPSEVQQHLETDNQLYQEQKQNRFKLAMEAARNDINNLDYEAALDNLETAAREQIELSQVSSCALRLPFFFSLQQAGDRLARAFDFLSDLPTGPEQLLALKQASQKPAALRSGPAQLPQQWHPVFEEDQKRHLPELKPIPGGAYKMGSEHGYPDEKPVHEVTVSDFYMSAAPITCWQYGLFCRLEGKKIPNDSGFGRAGRPVINVTWYDAVDYCIWLSNWLGLPPVYEREGDGITVHWQRDGFRLPTEAEWEYAAREGGKDVRFGNGKQKANPAEVNFNADAQYNQAARVPAEWYVPGEARECTTPVGTFPPTI